MRYAILLLLAGCCSTPAHFAIGTTPEPSLQDIPPYDLTLDHEPPLEVRLYLEEHPEVSLIRREELFRPIYQCAANDLEWSAAFKLCNSRIRAHDEALER